MKPFVRISAAFAALALSAVAAFAAPSSYKVDKDHTEIGFEVRHFFGKVHGRFTDFSGTIVFDDKDPAGISVDASAATSSIFTSNERRDADLKSANFFEAEKFPALTFKSTKVTAGTAKDHYKVAGDLTMHGVTKPVVFDGEFLGAGAVGVGGQSWGTKAGFAATTTINRKDWGITWNKTLDSGGTLLGDDVTLTLNIEANAVQPDKK